MKPVDLNELRKMQQIALQEAALKKVEDEKKLPKVHEISWEQSFVLILKILKASLAYWLKKHAMQGLSFALYHGRCQFVLLRYKSKPYKATVTQSNFNEYTDCMCDYECEVEKIPPPFSSQYGTGEIILKYVAPLETSYPDIVTEIHKDISRYRSHFPLGNDNDFEEVKPAFLSRFEKICFIPVVKFMQSPAGNEFIEFVHQQGLIFKTILKSSCKDDIDYIVSFK